ncbi:MAG: HlyD family efflux transporter periplasmic adaptor subunit [Methylobacteriaceae bacterium]|nr:HlyD family efflux transporter periplasmic adaptor subunit [Methylobacteriaceae bacterium]
MTASARQMQARSAIRPETALPLPEIVSKPERRSSPPSAQPRPRRPLRHGLVALLAIALGLAGLGSAVAWFKPDAALAALERLGFRGGLLADRLAARAPRPAPAISPETLPVVGLGRIEPAGEVIRVAAPSGVGDARVERLLVQEGDTVEAGARLATLDNETRLKAALTQIRADVAQRRAALERTRLVVDTERAQRQAAVSRSRAELDIARSELDRSKALFERGVTPAATLDQRTLAFRQATERLTEAEAAQSRYAGPLESQPDILLAAHELASAEAAVAKAEADLVQTSVTAPAGGQILKVHVRPGERIGSGSLLDMGATDTMMVRVEIYESDVGRLAVGRIATVTAQPLATPLTGAVDRVGLQVQRQAIVDATPAANTDARIVEAWIRLDPASSTRAAGLTGLQVRVRVQP